jgi:hypothetical protein
MFPRPAFKAIGMLVAVYLFPGMMVNASELPEVTKAKARKWEAISIGAFADSINHAVMKFEGKKAPYKQYTPDQIVHIAENVLAGQNLARTRMVAGQRIRIGSGSGRPTR